MGVRRLSHVVLRCADLERSRQFYETIGVQLNSEQHGAGSKHYSCTLGGLVLELCPFAGNPTSGLRLGLVVSNLENTVESLRAQAIPVTTVVAESATVTDPDGHQIVLERDRSP